jgi:Transposase DDE domain group 1
VRALRRTALHQAELENAQVGTIRLKLFKVAARVVVPARRVVFHLATGYPFQNLFRTVFRFIRQTRAGHATYKPRATPLGAFAPNGAATDQPRAAPWEQAKDTNQQSPERACQPGGPLRVRSRFPFVSVTRLACSIQ